MTREYFTEKQTPQVHLVPTKHEKRREIAEIEHFVHGHWVCKENSQDLNEPTGSQPAFSALQTLGDGTLGWGPEFHLCISPTRACLNRIGGMYQTPLRILGGSGHAEQQLDIP